MFPYPSGDLHMGHMRNYAIGDVVARYHTMQGYNVMNPMGWDAFGLPAENAAIKEGVHPQDRTLANIARMKEQFFKMGIVYDWAREVASCLPDYYHWTQWMFLLMYKRGLAYEEAAAGELVPQRPDRAGERAGGRRPLRALRRRWSRSKDLSQWFFKITDYAERLLDDLDTLDELARARARHAAQLDRALRGRGAGLAGRRQRRDDPLLHHAARHGLRRDVHGAGAGASAGRRADHARAAGRGGRLRRRRRAARPRSSAWRPTRRRRASSLGAHAINPFTGQDIPI